MFHIYFDRDIGRTSQVLWAALDWCIETLGAEHFSASGYSQVHSSDSGQCIIAKLAVGPNTLAMIRYEIVVQSIGFAQLLFVQRGYTLYIQINLAGFFFLMDSLDLFVHSLLIVIFFQRC